MKTINTFSKGFSIFLLVCGALMFVTMFVGPKSDANVQEAYYYSQTTKIAQANWEASNLSKEQSWYALQAAQVTYDSTSRQEAVDMQTLALSKYTDLKLAEWDSCDPRLLELGDKAGLQRPACGGL